MLSYQFKIIDMNVAPAVRDHPEFLKRAGDRTHAGALHAHHLRQKVLSERQIIANKALHAKQPPAHPVVNIVNRIAGGGLLHLRYKELLVLNEKLSQRRHLQGQFSQAARFDD